MTVIESNVEAFLLGMGVAGGGEERDDEQITWTVGGSPIGYHNAVVRCAADTDARGAELVGEFRTELRERGLPGCWHLSPMMRPDRLPELLAAAGFEDGGEEPAMAVPLSDWRDEREHAEALDVTLIRGDDDLHKYETVLAAGFGEGPTEAQWVASTFAAIGLAETAPWLHLLGTVDDEPVATASVLFTGTTAGIYFVSTRPEFRRRGFGTAITYRAMTEAAGRGATHAVLGSSPMGQRVYERLGFRTVFTYRLFEWEP